MKDSRREAVSRPSHCMADDRAFPRCARSRTRCAASGFVHVAGVRRSRARLSGRPGRRRPPWSCDPDRHIPGVCDSKTVPALERERLYERIMRDAVAWAVAVGRSRRDRPHQHPPGVAAARCSAPCCALAPLPDIVLVDAFRVPELPMAQRGVPHGDRRCSAIAAASIVAKVTRDRQMLRAARPRSALRLRSPQGLRDRRSPRRRCAVRLLRRAPPLVPPADAV